MGHCKSSAGGKFIAIQVYLKKQEESQINNLTLHLKQLEKRRNGEPQGQQKERNNKNWAEINKKETKETIAKINKANSWFFEKINKMDKLLARLIKKKMEKNQIKKIRNDLGMHVRIKDLKIKKIKN